MEVVIAILVLIGALAAIGVLNEAVAPDASPTSDIPTATAKTAPTIRKAFSKQSRPDHNLMNRHDELSALEIPREP